MMELDGLAVSGFTYHCTEGGMLPLMRRRLANEASWGYSLAEEDTINV